MINDSKAKNKWFDDQYKIEFDGHGLLLSCITVNDD